ncbi:MAG: spermidine synthase [candidate division BRC1 bacterium ADurb.BinA364]|nr:MAG: spermidine synthase [candidate division BRC1 bacterium ADurb.BinA364]
MFMAGLAAGGLALRAVPGRPLRGAAVCEGLLALLALGMAAAVPALLNQGLALHPLWRRSFFYGAMAAAGVLSGAQFALASHLWRSERPDVQRAAGGLEAADHLGAALGAIVFAIPLLPALGFAGAFLAIFALKAAGLPICAWPRR